MKNDTKWKWKWKWLSDNGLPRVLKDMIFDELIRLQVPCSPPLLQITKAVTMPTSSQKYAQQFLGYCVSEQCKVVEHTVFTWCKKSFPYELSKTVWCPMLIYASKQFGIYHDSECTTYAKKFTMVWTRSHSINRWHRPLFDCNDDDYVESESLTEQ